MSLNPKQLANGLVPSLHHPVTSDACTCVQGEQGKDVRMTLRSIFFHFKSICHASPYDKHPLIHWWISLPSLPCYSLHVCCLSSLFHPICVFHGFSEFPHWVRCVCCTFSRRHLQARPSKFRRGTVAAVRRVRVWQTALSSVLPWLRMMWSETKRAVFHPLINSHCSNWWLFCRVRAAGGVVEVWKSGVDADFH